MRRGFTLIEVTVVLGIIGVLSALSIPAYLQYQIRSDLNGAAEHISQALGRARLLSISGEGDGQWGVYAPAATIFQGDSYATRNAGRDETYPIPSTVSVTGLTEVTFSRLLGRPSATGTIILTTLYGAQRRIDIVLDREGIPTTVGDSLTICHKPGTAAEQTKQISDNALPSHLSHGDYLGECGGIPADYVLGQPNFTSDDNDTEQDAMDEPMSVAYGETGNRLFVSDTENRRVLVFDLEAISNGENAAYVIGQNDFTSKAGGTSQSRTDKNQGIAYDPTGNRLFVADTENSRVLVFDVASITNGENAVSVLGQSAFTGGSTGLSQSRLNKPEGLAYDSTGNRLFVADTENNRVLVFDVASIANGENAVAVLGQTDYTTNSSGTSQSKLKKPHGLAYDSGGGKLYVADTENNRVLVFDVASVTNGENAVNVLGQESFAAADGRTTQDGFKKPQGAAFDDENARLFVADTDNHRVIVFDVAAISDGEDAVAIFGQGSFTASNSDVTQRSLDKPAGVHYDRESDYLFIADSENNRVIVHTVDF